MLGLPPHSQNSTQIIQPVRIKGRDPSGDLQGIHGLIWGRRLESMNQESGIGLSDVKSIGIMGNDYISLIQELPKFAYQFSVILLIGLIGIEVRECLDLNILVTQPFEGHRQDEPVP